MGSALFAFGSAEHHSLRDKGITAMNAISTMSFANENGNSTRETERASSTGLSMGLGPNQLTWLRRNMSSFKQAEEQRSMMRQDVMRAARIAGLV